MSSCSKLALIILKTEEINTKFVIIAALAIKKVNAYDASNIQVLSPLLQNLFFFKQKYFSTEKINSMVFSTDTINSFY